MLSWRSHTVIFHTHKTSTSKCWWSMKQRDKTKKRLRPTCIQPSQQWRSDSQVLLFLTGRRSARRKDDGTGQDRRGEVEENGEVSFFFLVFSLSHHFLYTKKKVEGAGVWKVDQDGEKVALQPGHLVSPPSVCVMWLGERVLFIQVSWGNRCLILMPHLLWPLSLPYRSPSPSHWCIFISVVTWLFKGSLA